MPDELTFKDPHKRQTIRLKTISVDSLEVVGHQRKARPAHVDHLVSSIERIGFIVPLVAVEEESDGKPRYIVIDGQHRLQAARAVGVRKLPVLVVPQRLAPRMMNFNVEKDLNIREKGAVSLGIYRAFLDSKPELKENDPEVEDSIERAHYVTLGLAYERGSRLAGSSFEPLLKKCDFFLRRPLEGAYEVREQRAGRVLEASSLVKEVTSRAKDMGAWHQYFQYQLIAHIDPFRRKRGRQKFDELFEKAIAKLEKLNEEPDRIRRIAAA
ncbi:MAG: ParB/RepB/Spo0J family partition protein [Actinomycetota bacterium]|nr:ParB/RepB/Spo0J family partition protein [Actinomycetota bacterium]